MEPRHVRRAPYPLLRRARGSESRSVFAWGSARVAAEEVAEEGDIFVAYFLADLLHRAVGALEIVPRGVDAQPVEVGERCVARRSFEAARKVARAHSHLRRERV